MLYMKNIIPIAFAFDNNLVMPACICISSLMMNAHATTFYDIFILHSAKERLNKGLLDKLPQYFNNCRLTYREVDDTFDKAFEIRGITKPAYYRLLIPDLIREYDKILYSDVDVIFQKDLATVYEYDISNVYLAATYDWGMVIDADGIKHIKKTGGLKVGDYIQSGFLLLNSKKMREDKMVAKFKVLAKQNFKFQDQDILNIACGHCKKVLPLYCNMTDYAFHFLYRQPERLRNWCTEEELQIAKKPIMVHFNGHKPWKKYSVNFDIWWEYYRKSPFFDEKFYFDFFYSRLNEYDLLPLWKRIKILLRYFVYGRKAM